MTETSLKDRRILGEEGFVTVVVVLDSATGKLASGPEIHARGSGIDDAALDGVRSKVQEALEKSAAEGMSDPHQLEQVVRRVVGRWVNDAYRRRPMILPVVARGLIGARFSRGRDAGRARHGARTACDC